MKFIFKSILIVIVFLISLLIFLPKENLYNLAEKELQRQNIIISNELRKEKSFGLDINGAEVYYDGIYTAFVKEINLTSFLFYTSINLDSIRISKDFENMLPSKIKNIKLIHSLSTFNKVLIRANGEFGEFKGEVLLFERKIIGELKPSNIMKTKYRNLLRQFRLEEGKYRYEFKF